jgi:hypothetical protein
MTIEFEEVRVTRYRCNKCGWTWTPRVEAPSRCPNVHCSIDFVDDGLHDDRGFMVSDEHGNFPEEPEEVQEQLSDEEQKERAEKWWKY